MPYLAQSLSHVQLFATPRTIACQASLSTGVLQARILEWIENLCKICKEISKANTNIWIYLVKSWVVHILLFMFSAFSRLYYILCFHNFGIKKIKIKSYPGRVVASGLASALKPWFFGGHTPLLPLFSLYMSIMVLLGSFMISSFPVGLSLQSVNSPEEQKSRSVSLRLYS